MENVNPIKAVLKLVLLVVIGLEFGIVWAVLLGAGMLIADKASHYDSELSGETLLQAVYRLLEAVTYIGGLTAVMAIVGQITIYFGCPIVCFVWVHDIMFWRHRIANGTSEQPALLTI